MASADVRDELLCSICLTIYTDPVILRCGHNFCRVCIDQVLNTQDESGVYSCPECREEFQERPVLQRNITLRNVVERVRSTERHQEEITGICCTYCIHSPVPAVKSCLMCEVCLCDGHLKVHIKAGEHVLTEPTMSLEKRKCSVHKELLKYYCSKDAVCICVSCSLAGEHQGHRVEMLDEASEKKKKKLRNVLQKLTTKRKKTEERVQSLQESRRKAQEKASGEAKRVTALFIDIRRRLDNLEKKVLSEISRQEEQRSLSLSDVIQKLEIKKAELSMKMRHIEELCNMTDPLTVLQDPDTGDLCDPEEGGGDEDTGGHDKTHDVDVDGITGMLHAGLSDIMTYLQTISPPKPEEMRPQPPSARSLPSHTQDLPVSGTEYGGDGVIVRTGGVGGKVTAAGEGGIYGQGPADILLDVNTAHNNIQISDDLKTATKTEIRQNRPKTAKRFQDYPQVISIRRFTSGRHYWDVEIRELWLWRVGMCYPSIARRGQQSVIGSNNKSWGLCGGQWCNNQYSVRHDSKEVRLPHQISSNRLRICLDYEAGQLSFYELCDPIRHLHTFTDTFTEPLHAALYVYKGSIKILGRGLEETEERVRSLEESRRKAQEKESGEAERVTALFIAIRRRLDNLEKKVLSINNEDCEALLDPIQIEGQPLVKATRSIVTVSSGEKLHQILIPRRDAKIVLNAYHDQSGHFGVHKTEATIHQRFYLIGILSVSFLVNPEAMASADVRDKLLCSICLTIYTDPVILRCGHNFCQVCIDQFLNTQDESGVYSCPECREEFPERPVLQRNITLRNVVECILSTEPHHEEITGICCTYCIHSPVPAVKSCLLCEASLCDNHLRVHSKSPEHVLTDPSTNLEKRKCSVHKKVLEYYCTEDAACICVSCSLAGEHRGHRVEMLDEASEKKKKKLRNVLQKLMTKREKTEERVQSLEESRRKTEEKASGETERVTALFIDIRRRLDNLEKKILSEISRQEEQRSLSLSDVIQKLEIKKAELSMKMRHIEELCNMTDPLTVLQDPDTGDLCDPEEGGGDEDTGGHDKTHDVDVDGITGMLHAGLSDIMTYLQTISPAKPEEMRPQPPSARSLPSHTQDLPVSGTEYGGDGVIVRTGGVGGEVTAAGEGGIYGQGPADILLDVNTAGYNIQISDDRKTATTEIRQKHPETAERFQDCPQVISIRRFTSGRHYWDVEIRESLEWMVGMCYPSIDRRGLQSVIGCNNTSWCLYIGQWCNNQYSMIHNSKAIRLPHQISSNRLRICLDYEAGQLSFYELCDPIRHLHTFTDTFTEPLHAVLCLWGGSIKILGRGL
ncbi:LOW QUALITY PROTEIN: uncharacterized protein RB166_008234 [Leptodactylus fuscus]